MSALNNTVVSLTAEALAFASGRIPTAPEKRLHALAYVRRTVPGDLIPEGTASAIAQAIQAGSLSPDGHILHLA